MLKRVVTIIVACCLLPIMSHAAPWSLTTWAKTAGGAIQVGSDTPRTSLQGPLVTNYATETPVTVTVIPNAGYVTSRVDYNGAVLSYPTQTTFEVNGPNSQSVSAYFAILKFNITASVAGDFGGTVDPTAIVSLSPGALAEAKIITFTPASPDLKVSSISGIPAGAIQSPAVPGEGQAVTVTFPAGFTISSNIALIGTFTSINPVADAGSPQNAFNGATVTLNGTASTPGSAGISSYSWSQVSGPAVTLSTPAAAQARFIPTVAGTYMFSLTLAPGGSTAFATVNVYEGLPALVRVQCYNCHFAAGVGVAANVFGNWSSSGHKTKGIACSQCHIGADTGSHPGQIGLIWSGSVSATSFNFTDPPSNNFCSTCHNPAIVSDFAASKHSLRAGSASCSFCHTLGVHNPRAACADCHKTDNPYGLVWPPTGYSFHSSFTGINRICKGCHTTHNPKALNIKINCGP